MTGAILDYANSEWTIYDVLKMPHAFFSNANECAVIAFCSARGPRCRQSSVGRAGPEKAQRHPGFEKELEVSRCNAVPWLLG